jgi:hypothetical protein
MSAAESEQMGGEESIAVPRLSHLARHKGRSMRGVPGWMQVILYSFPAICWLYGAGILFSTFVSIVFWGASVQQLVESVRKNSTVVQPMGLRVTPLCSYASLCSNLHI